MKHRTRLLETVMFSLFAIIFLGGTEAAADEPRLLGFKVVRSAESGPLVAGPQLGGDDTVVVEIFPAVEEAYKRTLLISFPSCGEDPKTKGRPVMNLNTVILKKGTRPEYVEWKEPGPRWRMCSDANAYLLMPGRSVQVQVSVDFLRLVSENMSPKLAGLVYEITKEDLAVSRDPQVLAMLLRDRQATSSIVVDLYYKVYAPKETWYKGDYVKIFGAPQRLKEEGGVTQSYYSQRAVLPVDLEAYRTVRKLPDIKKDDGGAMFKRTLEEIYAQGSGEAGDQYCFFENIDTLNDSVGKAAILQEGINAVTAYSHILTGRFSTKWAGDHSLHPGFGFYVNAYTNETGSWKFLAGGWVEYDGNWQLKVPVDKGYQGKQLRILYRSYNNYYKPMNQAGNTYSWKDPDRYNIPANFDSGHRFADTDGGLYNGVGELVDAAMNMWSRLYWDGGINPVPSSPISFYFPNTWYDCGDGSGVPWSCANTSGEIWLIASHGIQADVVTHEMGHQLNNKFWNNKRPANSGGSHSLSGCYPTRLGMTLREGFANFIPAWLGYPSRNIAEGGFSSGRWALGYDAESRWSPPTCTNGWENEVWVAKTFWDLHDVRSDGDDILWFNHKGAVISLFLANGVASDGDARDIRYYENVYRNAASSGHEGFISDIFEQNRM